jgi:hypothetical protein
LSSLKFKLPNRSSGVVTQNRKAVPVETGGNLAVGVL